MKTAFKGRAASPSLRTLSFEDAASEYLTTARRYGPARGVYVVQPDASKSRLVQGVWYLRDARDHLLARVSKGGVRFAGWSLPAR